MGQFPIVGQKLNVTALHGNVIALVIGLLTSLWAGLGVTQAAQNAFDQVWAIPFKSRSSFVQSRLRGLTLLFSLGALFIIATLASGLVTGGLGHGGLVQVAGIVISLLLNVGLFAAAFRLMTNSAVTTRELLPGVVVAAILWTIMQALGGYYIGHVLKRTQDAYAQFGFVIALLIWLHLGAQMTIFSAEINTVLARKLWPRSFFGPPRADADQAALTALAKVEERSEAEKIDVEFKTDRPSRRPLGLKTCAGHDRAAQNRQSADSRRVDSSGHEQSPPSAGQPAQSARCGVGLTSNRRSRTPAASRLSSSSSPASSERSKAIVTGRCGTSRKQCATSTREAPARSAATAYTSRWVAYARCNDRHRIGAHRADRSCSRRSTRRRRARARGRRSRR